MDGHRADANVRADIGGRGCADAAQFFHQDAVSRFPGAHPAVLLREADAQQADFAQFPQSLTGHPVLPVNLGGQRGHLRFGELPDESAQGLMFG
jgi:hypothetical protein